MCSRISRAGNGSRMELEWQCIVLSVCPHHSAEPQQDISVPVWSAYVTVPGRNQFVAYFDCITAFKAQYL